MTKVDRLIVLCVAMLIILPLLNLQRWVVGILAFTFLLIKLNSKPQVK